MRLLTPLHQALQQSAREFVAKHIIPVAAEYDAVVPKCFPNVGTVPTDAWQPQLVETTLPAHLPLGGQ